jgi:hypothetical protein
LLLNSRCIDKQPSSQPISVTLPNGDRIISTHKARLPFPHFPHGTINAHIFLALHGQALLSVITFCDAGCTPEFTVQEVNINYKGKAELVGTRLDYGQLILTISIFLDHKQMAPTPPNSKATQSNSSTWHASTQPQQLRPNQI